MSGQGTQHSLCGLCRISNLIGTVLGVLVVCGLLTFAVFGLIYFVLGA